MKREGHYCAGAVLLLMLSVGLVAEAKTTTWNAAGGGNFSTDSNWDNGIPAVGDTVNLVANGDDIVFTNDLADLTIKSLSITGSAMKEHPCRIVGEGITLASYDVSCAVSSCVPITSTAGLTLQKNKGDVYFDILAPVTATGDIATVGSSSALRETIMFHGPVTAGGSIGHWGNTSVSFFDDVKSSRAYYGVYWTDAKAVFDGGIVDVGDMSIGAAEYYFRKSDAIVPTTVLNWNLASYVKGGISSSGKYYFDCPTMTIDRIHCDVVPVFPNGTWYDSYVIGTSSPDTKNTLTMKATVSDVSYAKMVNGLSLVYDPQGDFMQTCSNGVHTMNGTISVKGGVLRFNGATSLANVTAVTVYGGAFDLDSTVAGALSGLKALKVADGATFRATGAAAGSPFAATGLERAELSGTGRLALGAGVTCTVKRLAVRGVFPSAATYTGKGYGEGDVEEADWIEGPGRVTVVNAGCTSWKAAVNGDWSDATKWTGGVPTGNISAYVCAEGGNYTVTIDGGEMPMTLVAENAGPGTVTLKMQTATFENTSLTIGRDATVNVPEGGRFWYQGRETGAGDARLPVKVSSSPTEENALVKVENGGCFSITGGSAVFTNFVGYLAVGGADGSAGTISVTAGTLQFVRNNALDRIVVYRGGLMDFSGTGMFLPKGNGCVVGKTGNGANPSVVYRDKARNGDCQWLGGQGDVTYELRTMPAASTPNRFVIAPTYSCGSADSVAITQKTTVNLTNATLTVGDDKFVIAGGCPDGTVHSSGDMTGILNVRNGGTVDYSGANGNDRMYLDGLSLGYGAFSWFNVEKSGQGLQKLYGELNVFKGGSFVNRCGYTSVGVSHGSGRITVDGGVFSHASTARMFLMGVAGGRAECIVRGGSFAVNANDAYVGGAWTNVFPQGAYLYTWGWRPDNHAAMGVFRQEGGDVLFAHRVLLGVDGVGSFEQVGSGGTFEAGSLVFSNTTYNAASGGTARFTCDARGVRTVHVKDEVVIGENAKLVVDTADYPPVGAGIKLFSCPGGIKGVFSEVTLTGAFAQKSRLVYGATSIRLAGTCGLTILVR